MSWEKKRIPDFDHTCCVQGLNITTSQNSITEMGIGPHAAGYKKNYKPVKLKYFLQSDIAQKIFNHVNTDWLIISLLNTVIEKNYSLENRVWRQTSGWVTCAKPSRRNTDLGVSHTFSWRFQAKTTQNTLAMLYWKFLRKKKTIIKCFIWICYLPEIGFPVVKVENLYFQFFSSFTEPILTDFQYVVE